MQGKEVIRRVSEMAQPLAEELGAVLWDVEFEKEGGQYMLTVYIDKADGVDIDDCEKLSRALDPMLDRKEFSSMPAYTLCVSSAGLERRLKKAEHFAQFMDSPVVVKFYRAIDGVKMIEGILKGYEDGYVTVETEEGLRVCEPEDVASVRTAVVF